MLVTADGLPLNIAVSGANRHDSIFVEPILHSMPAIKGVGRGHPRRRPIKLHADKGYDYEQLRAWLRWRGITPRIARRGVETSERLGRHRRWIIERSTDLADRPPRAEPALRALRQALFTVILTWPPRALTCLQEAVHVRQALSRP